MKQRCIFKDSAYWSARIPEMAQSVKRMDKLAHDQKDDDELGPRGLRESWFRRLQLISVHYSAGSPIARIISMYEELLEKLAAFNANTIAVKNERGPYTSIDSYIEALSVLSLGILLRVPPKHLGPVITFAGKPGQDRLIDSLAVACGDSRKIAKKVLHEPFGWLTRALAVGSSLEAGEAIVEFLQKYYAGVRKAYFYNTHLNERASFYGYWSFESAAVAFMSDVNDSGFKDNVFYPADLTKYARR
jgi:hypothetical protein